MRIQFFRLWAVLALLSCLSGAWGQSIKSQPVKTKGIDPALLANAKAGDAEAEFYLSLRYFDLGNQKESCRWVRAAAENGDAVAQVALAGFYEFGSTGSNLCTVAKDYSQAAFWYRKAADQGKPGAEFALGNLYGNGQGVPQDLVQAVDWWRKAADQNIADAQYNLGVAYLNGEGVPVDYTEGIKWFRKAAEQGFPAAQTDLAHIYYSGKYFPRDYKLAAYWYRKAAGCTSGGNPILKPRLMGFTSPAPVGNEFSNDTFRITTATDFNLAAAFSTQEQVATTPVDWVQPIAANHYSLSPADGTSCLPPKVVPEERPLLTEAGLEKELFSIRRKD